MKRVLAAAVGMLATAGLVGSVNAADLPRRAAPAPMAPVYQQVFNWTGPYLGINGGGGWGTSSWSSTGSMSNSGGLIGLTAGYNWQANQLVFGLEGDIGWTNIGGSTSVATCVATGPCSTDNSWLGTVRGRFGYAVDRFMPYVTGGVAFGDIRARHPGFAGGSSNNTGWTIGGGVEAALAPQWTVKAEYLYVDLGSFACGVSCNLVAGDSVSFTTNIVRAGVNYKF